MLSKKYVVLIIFLTVVGGVITLTWGIGGGGEYEDTTPGGESYGLEGSRYTSGDLPAGVTVDGVVTTPLTAEHRETLSQSTYTIRVTSVETVDGQPTTVTTVYKKGESTGKITQSANNRVRKERYLLFDNGLMYKCDRTIGEECPTGVSQQTTMLTETSTLQTLLEAADWTPTRVRTNIAYDPVRLDASRIINQKRISNQFSISNVTAFQGSATVDSRQVITNLQINMTGTKGPRDARLEYRVRTSALNQTTVSRPNWVNS
jgi:hypothetical protein